MSAGTGDGKANMTEEEMTCDSCGTMDCAWQDKKNHPNRTASQDSWTPKPHPQVARCKDENCFVCKGYAEEQPQPQVAPLYDKVHGIDCLFDELKDCKTCEANPFNDKSQPQAAPLTGDFMPMKTAALMGYTENDLRKDIKRINKKQVAPTGELLELLKQFYVVWNRCESTRGCYACAEPHDCRCEKERGIGVCDCGRDELEALEFAIDNINEPCEPIPTAQDVLAVLKDDGIARKVDRYCPQCCENTVNAYRARVLAEVGEGNNDNT